MWNRVKSFWEEPFDFYHVKLFLAQTFFAQNGEAAYFFPPPRRGGGLLARIFTNGIQINLLMLIFMTKCFLKSLWQRETQAGDTTAILFGCRFFCEHHLVMQILQLGGGGGGAGGGGGG